MLVALALGACEARQPAQSAPPLDVYVLTSDHIQVYDLQGHIQRTLPVGTLAPDMSVIYVATANGVQAVDTRTGAVKRSVALNGSFPLPQPNVAGLPQGLSPNGRWLAVGGNGRFAVVDTAFTKEPAFISLSGEFEFDALSNDGRRLYLAEALPHGYQVRLYDLVTGLVAAPIVDKADVEAEMSGFRVTSVDEPEGRFHFGLYVRPNQAPFVHALPIYDNVGFAVCVFLPWPGYVAPTPDWSLVRGADVRFLYATSGMLRRVAEIDVSDFPRLARTLELPQMTGGRNPFVTDAMAKEEAIAPGAVISRDGSRLYFPDVDGVDVVDVGAFKLAGRLLQGEFLQSLVAGPDGSLFALGLTGSVFRIDANGRVIDRFEVPGRAQRLLFVASTAQHG